MLRFAGRGVALRTLIARPTKVPSRSIFSSLGSYFSDPNRSQSYHERKILPYRQHQLYDIVADVDAYDRFIPYCVASRVLKRASGDTADKILKLQAELKVGFMGIEEKYISDVECRPHEMVQAVASPGIPLFKSLVTTWRFQPTSASSPHPTADLTSTLHNPATLENRPTLVTIDLQYAFANPLHAHLSAAFFGQVSKMMIQAFEERCIEVYGPGIR
ncbi:dehydrase and lipid transport-domain-containing protein [Gautieria morchelliformis]|nr:dehydrase and lipid transport-domain-containing protein [Gautieria morchelliformis]